MANDGTDTTEFLMQYARLSRGAKFRYVNGVGLYTAPQLARAAGFDHGFTARSGGVSIGGFSSLNLSFTRPENRDNVMENYRIFCRAAEIPFDGMVMDNYEHGTTVRRVDRADAGRGYLRDPLPLCDGLVTNDPAVTLITGHADCMAFFVVDPVRRCIGLAHAGWRGALGRIGARVVGMLTEEFGTNPADVLAAVGPSICPDCFEVGQNVAKEFADAFPEIPCVLERAGARPHVDLWMVAFRQLLEAGVLAERVSLFDVCTMETPRLYSHRRDHGNTGGMAAYLRILP
ncbi:MAG: laccase domain-containing protein [Clostridiales bacterium]|nr:laccase domain-containing protein [Clostridiales bacterium]